MSIKTGIAMLIMIAVLIMQGFVAAPALAQTSAPTTARADKVSACSAYVGLANRVAGCIRGTLSNAAGKFFTGFYPMLSRGIAAVMTIGVAIFGAMAAMGMLERPARDVFVLLFKISMVGFFTTHADWSYHKILDVMDASSQAAVRFVPASGDAENADTNFSTIACLQRMRIAEEDSDGTRPVTGPWLGMDCILDSVIGIKVETRASSSTTGTISSIALADGETAKKAYNDKLAENEKGMSRGMINFFFSSMQSSIMGLLIAIIGFIFMYSLIFMMIKALLVYLAGYIGITLLMILSPLIIPMVMFRETRQYFDKWVKLLFSFALQPIIILVFVSFAIAAVDLATFSGSYSVMHRIAGKAVDTPGFSLNKFLEDGHVVIKKPHEIMRVITSDSKGTMSGKSTEGVATGLGITNCIQSKISGDSKLQGECAKSYPISAWKNDIDWKALVKAREAAGTPVVVDADAGIDGSKTLEEQKAIQISREIFASIIFAGIVVFVMNGLLKVIPAVAFDLIGDFAQSQQISKVGTVLPGQGKLQSSLTSALGSLTGRRG